MSTSKLDLIRQSLEERIPILHLLNMNCVDKSESFVAPTGEDYLVDGKVYFKIIKDKLPCDIYQNLFLQISQNHSLDAPCLLSTDEFYVMYDFTSETDKVEDVLAFALCRDGKYYRDCDFIGSLFMQMRYLHYYKEKTFIDLACRFVQSCREWIKEQIRMSLVRDVQGNLEMDNVIKTTYFQRRIDDDIDVVFDYIINEWDRRLANKESISWVDFLNAGKMFVALD